MSTEIKESEVVQPEKKSKAKGNGKPVGAVEDTAIVPRGDVDLLMVEAVRSGNIEAMERVMAIRRELKEEAAREAFFEAMSAFQAECPIIKKTEPVMNRAGTAALYHYAPLDKIVKAVGSLISDHGLSYTVKAGVRPPEKDGDLPKIVAQVIVHHIAGHSETSEFEVPIQPNDFTNKAQQAGNANTYAKRYAFCNAFGILTEDSDNDAGGDDPAVPMVTIDQIATIQSLIDEIGSDCKTGFLAYFKVGSIAALPAAKYQDAIKALEKKRAKSQ